MVPELHPFQELLLDVRLAGGAPVKLIIVRIARIEGAPRIKGTSWIQRAPGIKRASGVCNPARSRNPWTGMHIIPWGSGHPCSSISGAWA
jgi:hypothetical protein